MKEMKSKTGKDILIVTGGPLYEPFAKAYYEAGDWGMIIAADRGLEFAAGQNILPDLILGDFDSVDKGLADRYGRHYPDRIRRYPARKDETDTELALLQAIRSLKDAVGLDSADSGPASPASADSAPAFPASADLLSDHPAHDTSAQPAIHILGALGGRIDHMMGNIQLLLLALKAGVVCYLVDQNCRIRMTERPIRIRRDGQYGDLVSLIAYGADVAGLSLTGFGYNTDGEILAAAGARGISNYIVEEEGCISLTSGILLVIESKEAAD